MKLKAQSTALTDESSQSCIEQTPSIEVGFNPEKHGLETTKAICH